MSIVFYLFFVACFSAAISFFLDFALGFPMSEKPNTHAIFFKWTLFLAKRRMKKEDKDTYEIIKNDSIEVIRQAKTFFTYEYAIGYCSVCTNVWISLFCYAVFVFRFSINSNGLLVMWLVCPLSVILTSHIFLRKYLLA